MPYPRSAMSTGPSSTPPAPAGKPSSHVFQPPTGTRDFYPADLNRLRFLQDAWHRTSINHGFDEIDGPTFEHLEVYTAKSGEGIVSELFSFERFGGEKTFALRPEFTPTLARLYAAKAATLPKPTRWFWLQNCFRAERPQRGRLREFYQWNCDIVGDDSARADAEIIACAIGLFEALGLKPSDIQIRISNRWVLQKLVLSSGVSSDKLDAAYALLDRKAKIDKAEFAKSAQTIGLDVAAFERQAAEVQEASNRLLAATASGSAASDSSAPEEIRTLIEALRDCDVLPWCTFDLSIVRGLAYYTGTVFEAIVDGERAIAGGGRYDKLIELFGGPPTPAVGFGMGDVVLSLVLQDKGLMPTEDQIAERLGLRPDAFVVSNGTPEGDQTAPKVVAALRRAGLHARRTNKATKNVGKLIQDAAKQRARFCVIVENAQTAQLKDLNTQAQEPCPVAEIPDRLTKALSR